MEEKSNQPTEKWAEVPSQGDPRQLTETMRQPSAGAAAVITPGGDLPSVPGFVLEQEIARGGMGVIFKARDLAMNRTVAVKLLQEKYAVASLVAERFMEEAHITGQLQHPGIPPIYQVGKLADGRPYLAMKLIKGQTLEALLKANTPINKLAVFEAVAQAVGYAHAHGVIHRDLKPQNMMVGAFGEVQVMDWGLAKLLTAPRTGSASDGQREETPSVSTFYDPRAAAADSHTQAGSILGTPAFMPPEQAAGEIDKVDQRSDVFGLGAVLCQMLTGLPPFTGQDAQSIRLAAMRGKTEEAFARLENCGAEPDVIALCKRCLAFEASDRPADGNAVAKAVAVLRAAAEERAKQAELAQARAEVQAEEQRKRRRVVQVAGGLIAAVLLIGLGVSLWQMQRAFEAEQSARANEATARAERDEKEQQRLRAEEQTKLAESVSRFLREDVLQLADPETQLTGQKIKYDAEVKLRDVVIRAAQGIDGKFEDHPVEEAKLRLTLGYTLLGMGHPDLAARQYERAREICSKLLGPGQAVTQDTVHGLASAYFEMGRHDEALALFEQVLKLRRETLGPGHPDTIASMLGLAATYLALGRISEALALREETLRLCNAALGPDHLHTLTSMQHLANAYSAAGRHAEALALLQQTLRRSKEVLGGEHPDTLTTMSNLASSYAGVGRHAEAARLGEEALKLQKAKLGVDHPYTLMSMHNLANAYLALGRHAEALALLEEALKRCKEKLGPDDRRTLAVMNNLSACYFALGRHAEALAESEAALKLNSVKLGTDHPDTLISMYNVALCFAALGRFGESLKLHEEVLAGRKRILPASHADIAMSLFNIAWIHAQKVSKAEDQAKQAEITMDWLRQAVAAGYNDLGHLKKDTAFEPLRGREDFQKLLSDLEAKTGPPK